MKLPLLILQLFYYSFSFGQSQDEKNILSDFCDCYTKTKSIEVDINLPCITKIFKSGKHNAYIKKQAALKKQPATFETGLKIGEELFYRNQIQFINTCDEFRRLIDSARFSPLKTINIDTAKRSLEVLNKISSDKRNIDFFTRRGYFHLIAQNLDSAQQDFDSAIALGDTIPQTLYFKAIALEFQKKYEEAIMIYSKLATITKNDLYKLCAASANKKKNGL
jgi:tetratricopeptide (TPR) repeat protein